MAASLTNQSGQSGGSDTNASSYTTGSSWTPLANRKYYLFVNNWEGGTTPDVPSVSGNGMTWTNIASEAFESSVDSRITVFEGTGASPTAGQTTISFSSTQFAAMWSMNLGNDLDLSGTVIQSPTIDGESTTLSITLGAFGNAVNLYVVGFACYNNEVVTPEGTLTQASQKNDSAQQGTLAVCYRVGGADLSASATITTSTEWGVIGLELKGVAATNTFESMAKPTATATSLAIVSGIKSTMGKITATTEHLVATYATESVGSDTQFMGKMTATAVKLQSVVTVEIEEIIFNTDQAKDYFYKVYNDNEEFVETFPATYVPTFSWAINGGLSTVAYDLPRPYGQAGERDEFNIINTPRAALFTSASSQTLSVADNASLNIGDSDFSLCIWVNANSLTDETIISKFLPTGNQREWFIFYSANRFQAQVSGNGTSTTSTIANVFGIASIDTWYLLTLRHDSVNNIINLQVNQVLEPNVSHTTGIFNGSADLIFGRRGGGSIYWNGRQMAAMLTNNVLSNSDIDWIYNAGYGRSFDEFDMGQGYQIKSNMVSYWKLNETSGSRKDSVGNNTLTDNNFVTSSEGLPGRPQVKDLQLGYRIDTVVVDRESLLGVIVHTGIIEEYEITDPTSGSIPVTIIPYISRFNDNFIYGPIEFIDEDPTNMVKYFIDNGYLPGIIWDATNPLVGQKFTVTFSKQRVSEIIERIRRLGGSNWFWRLDSYNSLTFNYFNLKTTATHKIVGTNFSNVTYIRSRLDKKTRVFVFGAESHDEFGALVERIYGQAVAPNYDPTDPRDLFHTDSRITDNATALRIASSLLEFNNADSIETEITIMDSNQDPYYGYDIESLRPGDTLELFNPNQVYNKTRWGLFNWGEEEWNNSFAGLVQGPLVIANVEYRGTSAVVKLTNKPAAFVEELVNLQDRQLLEGST